MAQRRTRKATKQQKPKPPCEICGRNHRKKTSRQCIKDVLWSTLKDAMNLRDGGCCQRCGKLCYGGDSHMSHVYRAVRCGRLKFDLQNVKTMCGSCHRWWHDYEVESGIWFSAQFPERWEYLSEKIQDYRRTAGTIGMQWYRDRLEETRQYIRDKGGDVTQL